MLHLLQAPVWEVRRLAVDTLARIGDRAAVPGLVGRLEDDTHWVRGQAAEALGWIGAPEATGALTRALSDRSEFVRLRAVEALGAVVRWTCVEPFLPLLADPSPPVRVAAAVELGRQGDVRAVMPLVRGLESGIGPAAAEALGRIAARVPAPELRAALPPLRRLLAAPDPQWEPLYRTTLAKIEQVTAAFQDLPLPASAASLAAGLPCPAAKPAPLSVEEELERRAEQAVLCVPEGGWKERAAGYVGRKLRKE